VTVRVAFAGVAFLPYAVYVLAAAPLGRAFGTALAALALTLGPLVLVDRAFYGRWTVRGSVASLALQLWPAGLRTWHVSGCFQYL